MPYDAILTIRDEADAFLRAARRGLGPPVPGCPDWTVRELTQHLGSVHRFHTRHVTRAVADPPEPFVVQLPHDDELLTWFDTGVDELLIALNSTPLDGPAWNWATHTPQVLAFWPRRMALETAVHRWDAESAYGDSSPFDLAVALDGVDELLTVMGPMKPLADRLSGVVAVRPTDDEASWSVRLGQGRWELVEGGAADAVFQGTAATLLLALWGRVPAGTVSSGDPALIAVFTS